MYTYLPLQQLPIWFQPGSNKEIRGGNDYSTLNTTDHAMATEQHGGLQFSTGSVLPTALVMG
jgi:hypothetical protein